MAAAGFEGAVVDSISPTNVKLNSRFPPRTPGRAGAVLARDSKVRSVPMPETTKVMEELNRAELRAR